MPRTERYVVGILEQLLGPAEHGKRFPWAVGDVSAKTGRAARLPFDAVWESRKLIVEVDEDQHRAPEPFFDKPHRLTVSGVHRGEQRRRYDARKRAAAVVQGYQLVVIEWSRKRPQLSQDLHELRDLLAKEGLAV
jgi:very-short-patch-repair endonuclease